MTKKYLALRIRHYNDITTFLKEQGMQILQSRLETRDQALRNLTEGLFDRGLERVINRHELRWVQVEGEISDEEANTWSLCELCLDQKWFEDYKNNIRHYSGVAYWDATYGLAKDLMIKPQDRELSYIVEPQAVKVNNTEDKPQQDSTSMAAEMSSLKPITPTKKPHRKNRPTNETQLDLFG